MTEYPTAEWTAQQILEAFPDEEAPKYLIRDRDGIYGEYFRKRVAGMGIEEVITAPQSPFQTPYSAKCIASQLRSEPHLAIIRLMTWEEFQVLHLEVAREVGAERGLRVRLAEPEDLHDPAFEYKPIMMPRWGFFRRRPKLREIGVVFYQLDNQTQPYFIMGNFIYLNELDKLNASAYQRGIAEALRNGLEEAEKRRRNR